MDNQIAEAALKRVAERNGVSLETVLESIRAAIQQSELNMMEKKLGRAITPVEAVAFLGNAVYEARQGETHS